MERTLIIIKPDGVKRKLIGNIIKRIENKDYIIEDIIMKKLSKNELEKHYSEHIEKPFFIDLIKYMTSSKCILMIVKGDGAIQNMRKVIGSTDPLEADQASIRGMYATSKTQNIIHASDSVISADREIKLFFGNKNSMN